LVLVFSLIGMIGAAFYIHFATPLWRTEARIIITPSNPNPAAESQGATDASDIFLNTQCELIKSSPILALALSHVNADEMAIFQGVHNRVSYLKENLQVEVAKHSDILTVDLETPHPLEAQRLVQAIVNAYQDFQRRQVLSTDGQLLTTWQHAKDTCDAELDTKQHQLDDLESSQNISSAGVDNTSILMQRLSTLSNALTNAQLETLTDRAAYEQAARGAGINTSDPNWIAKNQADTSPGNLSDGSLDEDSIRSRLFDLQQQMAQLRRQYLPGHPAIQALQSRIDELSRSIVASARQRWETAKEHEQELQDSFDAQQKLAMTQNARNGDLTRLSADIRRLQDQSDSLDRRIKELSVTSQSNSFNIQMVDDATNSDDPVWPRLDVLLSSGLLGGALVGVLIGLMREASGVAFTIKSRSGGGKAMLGLPILTSIPRQGEVSIKHVAWSSHLRPESTIAVAFRSLRDALQAASAADPDLVAPRTILITSPMNGEGRTIAASNLAITLAKSGKRVCLVDADLRQPSLGKVYSLREDIGLTSVVAGSEPLTKAVQRSVIERLDLLPAGPSVDDPAELFNSPQFADTLEDLTLKYDHVIVDSSSVLSAPDARIVAASCDATILLLAQEGTTKRVAEQCRDGLTGVGATVIGIISNSAPKLARRPREDRNDPSRSVRKPALPEPTRTTSDVPQLPHRTRA
jgi:capsular exopolysaccharide synthesis family protein